MVPLNKQRILLVDAEPMYINILRQGLASHYNINTAINGANALAIANSDSPPDLILLDIDIPDMDAFEVLKALKNNSQTHPIPIIIITNNGAIEDEIRGLELGALDYVTKPFNMPITFARIRNLLALKKKSDLLEQLVSIDGLTEIPNFRYFDEMLNREWRRNLRSHHILSLIIIDIDNFKSYNDNYGYSKGDEILKYVAELLQKKLKRGSDFVARYKEDKFVVLVSEADLKIVAKIAENLRTAVIEAHIPHQHNQIHQQLSISLGLASCIPDKFIQANDLQNEAEKMLAQAKQLGGNRLAYASEGWHIK